MNGAPSPKYFVSAGNMDQTVCPSTLPSSPPRHAKRATVSSIRIPRCRRYHSTIAFGPFALKKMPPRPVTRTRCVRSAIARGRNPAIGAGGRSGCGEKGDEVKLLGGACKPADGVGGGDREGGGTGQGRGW